MEIWLASRGGEVTAFDAATRDARVSVDVGHRVAAIARDGARIAVAGDRRLTVLAGSGPGDVTSTTLPGPAGAVVVTASGPVVLCTGRRPALVWTDSGREVRVGSQAQALAHGHGSLWLARQSRPGMLERRDAVTGALDGEVEVHRDPQAVTCGPRWVWVGTDGPGGVDRVDPDALAVSATVEVDRQPAAITEHLGVLWVAHGSVPRITRIDPDSLEVVTTVRVGAGSFGIGVAGRHLWLTQTIASKVCVVDPRRNGVVARFDWDEPYAIG